MFLCQNIRDTSSPRLIVQSSSADRAVCDSTISTRTKEIGHDLNSLEDSNLSAILTQIAYDPGRAGCSPCPTNRAQTSIPSASSTALPTPTAKAKEQNFEPSNLCLRSLHLRHHHNMIHITLTTRMATWMRTRGCGRAMMGRNLRSRAISLGHCDGDPAEMGEVGQW